MVSIIPAIMKANLYMRAYYLIFISLGLGLGLTACKPAQDLALSPSATSTSSAPTSPAPISPVVVTSAAAVEGMAALDASMIKFMQAKSFHASIQMQTPQATTVEMDFVAPDRYRMQTPGGAQTIIGDIMHIEAQGQKTKVPLPKDAMQEWRDPIKLQANKQGVQVIAMGTDTMNGQPARKFQIKRADDPDADTYYWIDNNDLPLQLRHQNKNKEKAVNMTLLYSRFNDPSIVIEAP